MLCGAEMMDSNMKSALNGGLLVGTYDGATIEIIKAIGEENVFVFGHREEEIEAMRTQLKSMGVGMGTKWDVERAAVPSGFE